MNEALKMADQLHHHPTQSNADKAAALLRSQHAEIEQLKSEIKTEQSLSFREQVANQAEEIERLRFCFNQWLSKTEWVQEGIQEGTLHAKYLGVHRADIISMEIKRLKEELDEFDRSEDYFMRKAVYLQDEVNRLKTEKDLYFENMKIGQNSERSLRAERDALRAENQRLSKALTLIASCQSRVKGDVVDIAKRSKYKAAFDVLSKHSTASDARIEELSSALEQCIDALDRAKEESVADDLDGWYAYCNEVNLKAKEVLL